MSRATSILFEILGLQTPRGRLIFFAAASIIIFVTPYSWLAQLSLWQRIGIEAPSVGLTRAFWHVLHFEWLAAWHRNPLIYLVLLVGIPLLARDVFKIVRK